MSAGRKAKRGARPPGPKGARITGVMREFNRDSLGFIERVHREFGDIVWSRFLYVPALFIYHPNDIEYVLATRAKNFRKSMTLRSNFFRRLVGNGLLTSEGEEWKRQRRLTSPAFHRERIANYAGTMVDYSNRLITNWQDGETRDMHREMMRLTLEIVVRCLFSADVSQDVDEIGALERSRQTVCGAGNAEMDSEQQTANSLPHSVSPARPENRHGSLPDYRRAAREWNGRRR